MVRGNLSNTRFMGAGTDGIHDLARSRGRCCELEPFPFSDITDLYKAHEGMMVTEEVLHL